MREGGVWMHRRLPYMHRERCGDTAVAPIAFTPNRFY